MSLTVKQLSFDYPTRPLCKGIDFTLGPGQALQIAGPNGVGKTSLLKILCGLAEPSAGTVVCESELSYVGHKSGVSGLLTVWENLTLNQAYPVADPQAEQALMLLGLAGQRQQLAHTLSLGQQRRLALARLWLRDTKLWVLDEPFASLDQEAIHWLCSMLHRHVNNQGLLVFTSHQLIDHVDFDYQVLNLKHYVA